ncbi:hypothetical protein MCUN1_001264 [Malassezia cuniculi]|uniref:Uncharacterized protein n=1 Tax=Malassezia cuniculi TaxID=948313 RepID=A0AAF0J5N8_9BASI|nr:hypothetical protein MCUN1_001264 [Malassezia cuniculi]
MEFVPTRDLVSVGTLRRQVAQGAPIAHVRGALWQGIHAIRRACGLAEDGAVDQWIWMPTAGEPEKAMQVRVDSAATSSGRHITVPTVITREQDSLDAFEMRYVHGWLEAVIRWAFSQEQLEDIAEACSAHLVLLAGQAAAGERTHRYRFFTQDTPPQDASEAAAIVELREVALTEDAVGARTWGAATWLTLALLRQPLGFARALELGAGTGLVGLAVAARVPKVVLTDFHPTVLDNLAHNAQKSPYADRISVVPLDWRDIYNGGSGLAGDANERFDLVIAADCVYEAEHADWVAAVVREHLAFPRQDAPTPQLHLCMAVRATHAAETRSALRVFRDEPLRAAHEGHEYSLVMVDDVHIHATDDFAPIALRGGDEPRGRETSSGA